MKKLVGLKKTIEVDLGLASEAGVSPSLLNNEGQLYALGNWLLITTIYYV